MTLSTVMVWVASTIMLSGGDAKPVDQIAPHSPAFFERNVKPLIAEKCLPCHGPDKQKSSYRLDVREVAFKGGDSGKPAIVPHDASHSPLIHYVSGEDPEITMPPVKSNVARLTKDQIDTLRTWINAGPVWPVALADGNADGEPHWSLLPLVKPPLPQNEISESVASNQSPKTRPLTSNTLPHEHPNPIDAFIQAKLAVKHLAPSPEADRRTLIRRVTYDLTGLPSTPEELAAFENDSDPMAYEKLVDRLLASPRFGERWARHWLDTIHFADSHGYEHDIGRENAWRFRDYVIEAFNNDTPWSRFIREQLAADVFFPREPRLTAALGFLGAGLFDLSTFGTAKDTFDYIDRDDLVTQTMTAFVSTTANCARCHAHKFDPIPQEDYYALQAVFAGVLKGDVSYDEDVTVMDARRHWNSLIAAADAKDASVLLTAENDGLSAMWLKRHSQTAKWQRLEPDTFLSVEGATLVRETNGVFLASGPRPDKDNYILTFSTPMTNVTALRLDVFAHDSLPMHGPGRQDNGNLHLTEFEAQVFEPDKAQSSTVKFQRATADFNQDGWGIERALDGDTKTAWGIYPEVGKSHHAVFELAEPLTLKSGSRLSITLRQAHGGGHLIGAFSLTATTDPVTTVEARPTEVEAALAIPPEKRDEHQSVALAAYALKRLANEKLSGLPPQSRVYAAGTKVDIPSGNPVSQPKALPEPKEVHVLYRGQFDQPRDLAKPGALSMLTHLPARFTLSDSKNEALRRAALADWIAHPDNVLTWRSIVNRVWHYHFVRGLCDTPSDLGRMGGTPSHPELLDWLAVWFRDDAGGSLKALHKLIVTSATYRQTSDDREDAVKVDGDNRLLWRQNSHRIDADAFRDFTLAVSGRLDLKMGGPGVKNFKESKGPQATPSLDYTDYDWNSPGSGRRSIYRVVWRGIPDPLMEALDFPDLGLLSPTRTFSASSLQALTLYNNGFVLYHSKAFASRVSAQSNDVETQTGLAVRLAWLREPRPDEERHYVEFVRDHGLASFCRLLLNSNEFLFVN